MTTDQNTDTISFKSVLKKEVKHASVYTTATFLTQFGSFLLVPLFWQRLTPTDYGVIGVTEIINAFLGAFWGLSLEASISRFYYEWPEKERRRRLGVIWVVSWGSSVILGMFSLLVLWFTSSLLFPDVAFFPFVFLGVTHAIMAKLRAITFTTIRIKQMSWLYSIYNLAIFVVLMASSIYFVMILDWGLYGYFVARNISEAILVLMCTILMSRFAVPCLRHAGIRKALRFSLPLIPGAIADGFASVLDRFILQQFASLDVLGIYSVSLKFTNLIGALHNALKMSFAPFIFKSVSEEGRGAAKNIGRIRMFYLVPILVTGMAMSVYIGDFVRLVNQPSYSSVAQYVPLLVGPVIISTFNAYFASGLLLAKRTDLLWIPSAIQVVFVLVGGVLLIPTFQLDGVIISRYMSVLSFTVIGFILSQKYYPIPINWTQVFLLAIFLMTGVGISHYWENGPVLVSIALNTLVVISFSAGTLIVVTGMSTLRQAWNNRNSISVFGVRS